MRDRRFDQYFRTLGLSPRAGAAEVQHAFRELARRHHPDVSRRGDASRFIEIVRAYQQLREVLREEAELSSWGPCGRCGRHADLYDPLGRGAECADCLLGETSRRRMLPGPQMVVVIARHLGVFALYAASAVLAVRVTATQQWTDGALALACAVGGLLTLAFEVIRITAREAD
jgi:hypothetical protein